MSISTEDIRGYYEEMTEAYLRYGGSTFGMHVGLAEDPETSHPEALLRANEFITRGLGLNPEMTVVDAGCGVGGLAFYIAENFGARVLGLTLCPAHVEVAVAEAESRGLSQLVEFRVHDFMEPLAESHFCDAVFSQDAFCHAPDGSRYLQNVSRMLKPAGAWRAVDAFRGGNVSAPEDDPWIEKIRLGWKVDEFLPVRSVQELAASLGFREVSFTDVSTQAYPAARGFMTALVGLDLFDRLGIEVPDAKANGSLTFRNHMASNAAWASGLLNGDICYGMVEAWAPCQ